MSATVPPENPMSTVLRLIGNRIRVVKDDNSVATVRCSEENYDRELLKGIDGHITCSLVDRQDQKLNNNGTKRRKVVFLKVLTTSANRELPSADPGRTMRDKIATQINNIIRECRQIPYITTYNFYGLGYPEGAPHKAKDADASSELTPSAASWLELDASNYQKIWANDDVLHSKVTSVTGQYPQMLFCFKIGKSVNTDLQPLKTCLKQIMLTWIGYGIVAAGVDGATIKVWNSQTNTWTNAASGTGSAKETLSITLTENLTNYADANGYLWLIARTTNPSSGAAATLYCDFVQCVIYVQGLSYIDVVSDKPSDIIDVKPFLFKHEFQLRGFYFEDILL